MEQQKQETIVKRALDLQLRIDTLESLLPRKRAEALGKTEPQPPVRKQAAYTEPPIKHGCKINWLLMLGPIVILFLLASFSGSVLLVVLITASVFIWPAAYYFGIYRKQKAAAIAQIHNSDEYRKQYADAQAAANEQQRQFDAEYEKALAEYESVLLPQYQTERSAWEAEHRAQIEKMEQELAQLKQELAALYEQTRIVPAQYWDAYALQYIYDMISTSDYDVRQAIAHFDKSEQRQLEMMRIQEQQQANALAMEQNELLDRQNTIAAKARRDANIAAVVGTVQRHNTNKTIKKWLDK